MTSILMITRTNYPTYDSMLETVFTRILPEWGYDITFLMPSTTVTEPSLESWNKAQVYLFPVPADPHGLYAYARDTYSWFRLLLFAARLLMRKRFDIIQTRAKTTAQVFAYAISKLTRVRHVTQHDYPHPEGTLIDLREGRRRKPWLNIPYAHLQILLRDWMFRHADLVLAISDEMRRQLISSGVRADRVVSFPMGTDCPPDPSQPSLPGFEHN